MTDDITPITTQPLYSADHGIEWRCPACARPSSQMLEGTMLLHCEYCDHQQCYTEGVDNEDGQILDPLQECVVCGYERLFTQKDFNRKLGILVVAIGAVLSPWTYGLSLLGCMLLDYALYYIVPEITVCYGCDAIYRGFQNNPRHRAHDPLLAERYKRQAQAEGRIPGNPNEATSESA